jgi:hypothetical protein
MNRNGVLKEHPYFPKSAESFSPEALKHLFELSLTTIGQNYRFISQLMFTIAYLAMLNSLIKILLVVLNLVIFNLI